MKTTAFRCTGALRVKTYALGLSAELSALEGRNDEAIALTREAIFWAQQADLPDALFQWEWNTGGWEKGHDMDLAIGAYRRATETLRGIRNDLAVGANGVRDGSFREAVGGVFYELSDLLLQKSALYRGPRIVTLFNITRFER